MHPTRRIGDRSPAATASGRGGLPPSCQASHVSTYHGDSWAVHAMPCTLLVASIVGGDTVRKKTNASSSTSSFNCEYASLSLAGSVSVAPVEISCTYFSLLNAELFRSGL